MAVEPVSLAEAREHLKLDTTSGTHPDDGLVLGLIAAARGQVEMLTGRTLVAQTRDEEWDAFPAVLELLHTPVTAVTWVKYVADDGTLTTLATDQYRTDIASTPARITPAYDVEWPSTRRVTNAVQVRYETGAVADVAPALKHAVMLLAAHWYENRAPIGAGSLAEMPHMIRDLVGTFRVARL